MADKVGGDKGVFGILDDALVRAQGGLLDGGLDLVVGRALLDANHEVDDRHVQGGDTERKTAV